MELFLIYVCNLTLCNKGTCHGNGEQRDYTGKPCMIAWYSGKNDTAARKALCWFSKSREFIQTNIDFIKDNNIQHASVMFNVCKTMNSVYEYRVTVVYEEFRSVEWPMYVFV